MKLPVAVIRSMTADHRYALLMLGIFINEANWLRKLLVRAVLGTADDEPEGSGKFFVDHSIGDNTSARYNLGVKAWPSRVSLAGKIHEGWNLMLTANWARYSTTSGCRKCE
jgi:hypothetical protein